MIPKIADRHRSRQACIYIRPSTLAQVCAIAGTVVIDEDGVYNPADFNDGLALGMKGTFAQAELHMARHRMPEAAERAAARVGYRRFITMP